MHYNTQLSPGEKKRERGTCVHTFSCQILLSSIKKRNIYTHTQNMCKDQLIINFVFLVKQKEYAFLSADLFPVKTYLYSIIYINNKFIFFTAKDHVLTEQACVLYVFPPWFLIYFSLMVFFHMVRKIRLLSKWQQKRTKSRTEQLEGTFKDHLVQPPDHFRMESKIYQLFRNLKKLWNAALLCTYERFILALIFKKVGFSSQYKKATLITDSKCMR